MASAAPTTTTTTNGINGIKSNGTVEPINRTEDDSSPFLRPPTETTHNHLQTETQQSIESHITTHPLTLRLRADPAYTESRPHLHFPESYRQTSLTAGTLLGSNRVEVPPFIFTSHDELYSISFLGSELCGHPGIIHGGLLATLLDEGLARCAFNSLPNKIGVTASLKVDYLRPVIAEQFVVLRAKTEKVDGRKCWVKGWIETLVEEGEGVKLCQAEGLFVEPKGAVLERLMRPGGRGAVSESLQKTAGEGEVKRAPNGSVIEEA